MHTDVKRRHSPLPRPRCPLCLAPRPPPLQAFSSYLLIAWVSTNVIFVAASTLLANSTWETCAMTEAEMAVNAVKAQAVQGDKALAMADLIQTAVTLLRRGEALYPFNGLQGFPQNYPMLVTGDAQVRGRAGARRRAGGCRGLPPAPAQCCFA